jgi:hypothetical protein
VAGTVGQKFSDDVISGFGNPMTILDILEDKHLIDKTGE